MQVLLDECVPRPLKRELSDYQVRTVVEMGWSGKKNGELLQLMSESGFTVLLTTDRNLQYQQNLQQAGVAVVVMVASSNRLLDLIPLIPKVGNAIALVRRVLLNRIPVELRCSYKLNAMGVKPWSRSLLSIR